jgi:YaiO family outer membrane protein
MRPALILCFLFFSATCARGDSAPPSASPSPAHILFRLERVENSGSTAPWTDATIEAGVSAGSWKLVPRVLVAERYRQNDAEASLEAYPPPFTYKGGGWSFLSASAAPGSSFLPRWTVGGGIYKTLGRAEASIGYRHMEYRDSGVELLSAGVSLYQIQRLTLEARIYTAFSGGHSAFSGGPAVIFEPRPRQKYYLKVVTGKQIDNDADIDQVTRYRQLETRGGAEFPLGARTDLLAELSITDRKDLFDSTGFMLGCRYRW